MSTKKSNSKSIKISKQTEVFFKKFKTEICRNWTLGLCPFGENCAFAHGEDEIRNAKPVNYKTKKCKQFHEIGYCQYGSKCQFLHIHINPKTASTSPETQRKEDTETSKKRLPVFVMLAQVPQSN